MSKDKAKIIVTKDESNLESAILDSYDACLLNKSLHEEKDLFERYQHNTEILYQYLRAVTTDFIYPLSNEIRAMFGHLTEFNQSGYTKTKELELTNGHFRRLNIDALKMICDDFDKFFSTKLKKHSKYDYRSVKSDYLEEFATKYFEAKKDYLLAQIEESVGSDSEKSEEKQDDDEKNKHNVIKLYHEAATKYIVLKQFYMEHIKTILAAVTNDVITLLALFFSLSGRIWDKILNKIIRIIK